MILDEILKKTKQDLKDRQKIVPFDLLGRSLAHNPFMPKDVISALWVLYEFSIFNNNSIHHQNGNHLKFFGNIAGNVTLCLTLCYFGMHVAKFIL